MTDGGTLVEDGIWTVHQRPRAVETDGLTFIGWIDTEANIGITEVDHSAGETVHKTLGAVSLADDHSSPAIYIRDDDRIVVFWSDRSTDTEEMRYRISDDALDISSWSGVQTFTSDPNTDYPQPLMYEGELYIFYRGGWGGEGAWAYRTSDDGGDSFGSEKLLVEFETDWIYIHPYVDGNKIHFALGDHRMDNPGIYHWYLENGSFYQSDGTFIQDADDPLRDLNDLTLVYDAEASGNNPAKQYDLITESNGNPHVAFTEHVETGTGGGDGDYRARWAAWDGSEWVVGSEITEMGGALPEDHYYESGLSLDSQDPETVYVSVETDGRNYQIQEWTTDDGGSSWTKVSDLSPGGSELTDPYPTKRGRPISPRDHGPELPAIWWGGHYNDFTEYKTQIRRDLS